MLSDCGAGNTVRMVAWGFAWSREVEEYAGGGFALLTDDGALLIHTFNRTSQPGSVTERYELLTGEPIDFKSERLFAFDVVADDIKPYPADFNPAWGTARAQDVEAEVRRQHFAANPGLAEEIAQRRQLQPLDFSADPALEAELDEFFRDDERPEATQEGPPGAA